MLDYVTDSRWLRVLLAILPMTDLDAQTARPNRPIEIVGTWSGVSISQAIIERAMVAADLDHTTPGGCFFDFCTTPRSHPRSFAPYASGTVSVGYTFSHRWAARLLSSSTPLGSTSGYHSSGSLLSLERDVQARAIVVDHVIGAFRLGAGPAWYRTRVRRYGVGGPWPQQRTRRVGFLAELTATVNPDSRVFVAPLLQWRAVGSVPIGPFTVGGGAATFPRTSVSFSNFTFGVGLGVRF